MGKHFKWYHGEWGLNNLSPGTTAALVEAIDTQPIPAPSFKLWPERPFQGNWNHVPNQMSSLTLSALPLQLSLNTIYSL